MRPETSEVPGGAKPFAPMSRMFLRFGFLGAAQLAGSALSFLTAIIITRVAGAAVFGQVSVGLSVLGYGLIITNFGTDISGVRMAAASPKRIGAMLPAILLMRLFFGILAFIAILLFSPILAPDPVGRAILLLICGGLFAAAFFPAWLPQGIENIRVTALCVFGPFALTFVFTLLSALLVPHGVAFAASRLAGDLVIAAAISGWAWRYLDRSGWPAIRKAIKDLIGQSSAIAGSELVRGLAFLSDMLIVAFFFHDVTVGHFSAAYRIYLLLIAVAAMYSIVLFPRLSRAAVDGSGALKAELGSTLLWAVPIVSVLTLALIAIVPWVLPFAFGSDFSAAVPALQLLAVAATLNFVHRNYSRTLIAMHLANIDLHVKSAVTVVGIAVKVLGTWQWGITGMAASILLSELILLVLLQWNTHGRLRVGTAI
jgi:O-antigen/teichoic acid export membrane protein